MGFSKDEGFFEKNLKDVYGQVEITDNTMSKEDLIKLLQIYFEQEFDKAGKKEEKEYRNGLCNWKNGWENSDYYRVLASALLGEVTNPNSDGDEKDKITGAMGYSLWKTHIFKGDDKAQETVEKDLIGLGDFVRDFNSLSKYDFANRYGSEYQSGVFLGFSTYLHSKEELDKKGFVFVNSKEEASQMKAEINQTPDFEDYEIEDYKKYSQARILEALQTLGHAKTTVNSTNYKMLIASVRALYDQAVIGVPLAKNAEAIKAVKAVKNRINAYVNNKTSVKENAEGKLIAVQSLAYAINDCIRAENLGAEGVKEIDIEKLVADMDNIKRTYKTETAKTLTQEEKEAEQQKQNDIAREEIFADVKIEF